VLVGLKNNDNNKQICIVPEGHDFRGAGVRQRVSEQRKKRKPGNRGTSLAWTLKTVTESPFMMTCVRWILGYMRREI